MKNNRGGCLGCLNGRYGTASNSGFYRRDVVSAVLATATWLDGWMSHAGIVSKWLKLS